MPNKKCSKPECPKPAKSPGSWCAEHRAAYQREYNETRFAQAEGKGFALGVEAMRKTVADEFQRLGSAVVTCLEVSKAVKVIPRPELRLIRQDQLNGT